MPVREPERRVFARRGEIVRLDKVSAVVEHVDYFGVERIGQPQVERGVGEVLHELVKRRVDEVDPRRFQGFQKARRQPDSDAVVDPRPLVAPDPELDLVERLIVREAPEVEEVGGGLVAGGELAREDVTAAEPAQHRNLPGPPRVHGDRGGVRLDPHLRVVGGYGGGDRAVAQQVVGHVNEGLLQGLVDQEPPHAGAVDEQVRLQLPALLGEQAGDEAAIVQLDLHDLVDHAVHSAIDGPARQEIGHQVRVEVPRVGHLTAAVVQARCQIAIERLGLRVAGVLHRLLKALFALAQPVVGKRHSVAVRHTAEQMVEVIVTRGVG
ncbi:Uncharacterised protein [Yersinia intermedia]|nr:Uncharacterised protein [Yersinia intermedia]CNG99880.1 Uncharacterised protein [Yersinia intermedia]